MIPYPAIIEYDNYRTFLGDLYRHLKSKNAKFSLRYFARIAGFQSHNFLRMVMIGKSNLSPESVEKFSKAFKFNKEEADFFRSLVLFNQAPTHEAKQAFADELVRSKAYRKIHPLSESQYLFFKHWYFTAVRELTALPGFQEDPDWIAKRTIPRISPQQARHALEELLNMGLLKRNEEGGLIRSEAQTSTTDEVTSTYVSGWHKEYLRLAAESIDTVKRDERDISAVYVVFNQEHLKLIKEKIHAFRKEILELETKQDNPNAVYQVNLQLFPVAKLDEGGS